MSYSHSSGTIVNYDPNYDPALTGSVVTTVLEKLRETVSVFDFMTAAQIASVRARNLVEDVTVPLNTAFAYCSNNRRRCYMPEGTYKITDTLYPVPAGTNFKSVEVVGAGAGFDSLSALTVINATALTDRPAINLQVVRGVYLGHFAVIGSGKTIASTIPVGERYYNAAYVTPGYRDSQYSPHCGIAIDAGAGNTPPDGGYPGMTYRNTGSPSGSADITFDHIQVRNFVVGFMLNPEWPNAVQGDTIYWLNPIIYDTKVGIAVGSHEARNCIVWGGQFHHFRSAYSGTDYGVKQGVPPAFYNTQIVGGFEAFSHGGGFGVLSVFGGRFETIHRIGFGGQADSLADATVFYNVDVSLLQPVPGQGKACPIVWEGHGSFRMVGGDLGWATHNSYFFLSDATTLEDVQVRIANRFRPYVGEYIDLGRPTILRNVRVVDTSSQLTYGKDARENNAGLSGRLSEHRGGTFRRSATSLYYVQPGLNNTSVGIITESNRVWTDDTLTFDNTNAAGSLMVGDILTALMHPVGQSSLGRAAPSLKITSIVGTTVTCDLLYPRFYYNEADAPTFSRVLVHEWAPGQALTGDLASGSPTVSNVSPTTILQLGDWIASHAGIPTLTRVNAISGTTITLSRNATATITGAPLFWGQLVKLDKRFASVTWDPPSVAAAAQTTTTVTVAGAVLGDPITVGFNQDLQAMQLTGYVSAANVVTVVLQNGTAAPIDLASGSLRVDVWSR